MNYAHNKNVVVVKKANKELDIIKQRIINKRKHLSSKSQNRVKAWADNLQHNECQSMIRGASREASVQKRQHFESGNWDGKQLNSEMKFYDKIYVRKYAPESVSQMQSQIQNKTFYDDHLELDPYTDQLLQNSHNPDQKLKKLLRQRFKVSEQ